MAVIAQKYYDERVADECRHLSFLATEALEEAQKAFEESTGWDAEFYGVEGSAEHHYLYLNTGDTYKNTLLFQNGKFFERCWGDLEEEAMMDKEE